MGQMVQRLHLQANRRCEICQKPVKEGYKINIEGYGVFVCSGAHAEIARSRWEEKVKLGITPQHPQGTKDTTEEMMSDNIEEIEMG